MRAFVISDTHFGVYPINSDKWLKMMVKYFKEFFIPLLKKESLPGDIVIHCGDLFDNRNQIPVEVISTVIDLFEEIGQILPVHMLIGNHDISNKSTNDINSPKSIKFIPNITLYETTTKVRFDNRDVLMMPWVEHKNEQIALLRKYSGCDYLFCHSDLNGARLHLKSVAHKNRDKIEVVEFGGFKKVYSGHIHLVQRSANFTFVGSPYEMDRNDMSNQKGIFILDFDDMSEKFIPNTLSPRFEKLSILTEMDVEDLGVINTNNYIDLYISNSLLIGNRKLRRKLEKILETGGFSSVEYIDDINEAKQVETDVEKGLRETEFTTETNFEFESMIKDYIQQQTYDADKTKLGVLGEYEHIIDIYNTNYKFKKED
jgi:DNA repair exonuclease SbcCD nuclease subunit